MKEKERDNIYQFIYERVCERCGEKYNESPLNKLIHVLECSPVEERTRDIPKVSRLHYVEKLLKYKHGRR